jgi:hypothetical protein
MGGAEGIQRRAPRVIGAGWHSRWRIARANNPEVGNTIICFDQQFREIGPGRSGANYAGNGHAYQWNVSTLITAPVQNPAENVFLPDLDLRDQRS